mgnify:CR=1 FL=1
MTPRTSDNCLRLVDKGGTHYIGRQPQAELQGSAAHSHINLPHTQPVNPSAVPWPPSLPTPNDEAQTTPSDPNPWIWTGELWIIPYSDGSYHRCLPHGNPEYVPAWHGQTRPFDVPSAHLQSLSRGETLASANPDSRHSQSSGDGGHGHEDAPGTHLGTSQGYLPTPLPTPREGAQPSHDTLISGNMQGVEGAGTASDRYRAPVPQQSQPYFAERNPNPTHNYPLEGIQHSHHCNHPNSTPEEINPPIAPGSRQGSGDYISPQFLPNLTETPQQIYQDYNPEAHPPVQRCLPFDHRHRDRSPTHTVDSSSSIDSLDTRDFEASQWNDRGGPATPRPSLRKSLPQNTQGRPPVDRDQRQVPVQYPASPAPSAAQHSHPPSHTHNLHPPVNVNARPNTQSAGLGVKDSEPPEEPRFREHERVAQNQRPPAHPQAMPNFGMRPYSQGCPPAQLNPQGLPPAPFQAMGENTQYSHWQVPPHTRRERAPFPLPPPGMRRCLVLGPSAEPERELGAEGDEMARIPNDPKAAGTGGRTISTSSPQVVTVEEMRAARLKKFAM